jgi:hypothetical protein
VATPLSLDARTGSFASLPYDRFAKRKFTEVSVPRQGGGSREGYESRITSVRMRGQASTVLSNRAALRHLRQRSTAQPEACSELGSDFIRAVSNSVVSATLRG